MAGRSTVPCALVETNIARRYLIAVLSSLAAWSRLVDPSNPRLVAASRTVAAGLQQARVLVARGKASAETVPGQARELLRGALGLCADLPEARAGLRICPPEPPTELVAVFVVDHVSLRWTATPPDGLGPMEYRVVRKIGGPPANIHDGQPIRDVDNCLLEDRDVAPGATVGYTVFTIRDGVTSLVGAMVGPIVAPAEVAGLRAEASSREVMLSWQPPSANVEVRLVRKPGSPPEGVNDGVVVPSLNGQAIDRGVEDDQVYH